MKPSIAKQRRAFDWLRTLVNDHLSNRRFTARQIAIEAMLIDLLDYTDGRIDEAALDRSVAAFKEYNVKVLK